MTSFRLFLVSFLLLISYGVRAQNKHFVRPYFSGSHTGKTWALAFDNLETAIDSAKAGDSIFVRWGNYSPLRIAGGIPISVRSRAFILKNGVKIYGGFAGWETTLAERDTSALFTRDVSSLLGELGELYPMDNLYHVVLALHLDSTTIFDGFNIVSGYANGITTDTVNGILIRRDVGGAIYSDSSSLQIAHVNLYDNFALTGGGGMYNSNHSNLSIRNSKIEKNTAGFSTMTDLSMGGGGGVLNVNSTPRFDSVRFIKNKSLMRQGGGGVRNEGGNVVIANSIFEYNYVNGGDGGGAVYNQKCKASILNTSIQGDSTNARGGGMYNDSSSIVLKDVIFGNANAANGGGGMQNTGKNDIVLTDVLFRGNFTRANGGAIQNQQCSPVLNTVSFVQNRAYGSGGGIYNYDNSSPRLTDCMFTENRTDTGNGGGFYNYDNSSPQLSHCLFAENRSATGNGGGFCNRRNSHPVLTNCLFTYNFAGVLGAGLSNSAETATGFEPASLTLTNVTIANNNAHYSGGGMYDDGFGSTRVRNSIIQGNHSYLYEDLDIPSPALSGALFNTIVADEFFLPGTSTPTFVSKRVFLDTFARDFRLAAGSPALDMGDSSFYASSATPDLSAIKSDIRGARRIMGNNVDLGAYEVCEDSTMAISIAVTPGTDISPGVSVTFTATVRATGLTAAYTWRKNSVIIAGATGATYSGIAGTDFISGDIITAAFKSATVCTDTDSANSNPIKMRVIPVGIHSYTTNQSEISLFPNPNQGNFTIKTDFIAGADYQLMVNDVTGRTVYQESFVAAAGNTNKEIMLDNKLNTGVYFLSVKRDNQNKQVIRFVVK